MSTSDPDPRANRTMEVQILGQRMTLKTGGDPARLDRLVSYVKRKVDELAAAGTINGTKLAALTALNIADDYFRALEEAREFKHQVAKKSRSMLAELEQHHHARARAEGLGREDRE